MDAGWIVKLLVATAWLLLSGCTVLSQPPTLFDNDSRRDGDGVAYLWIAAKVKQPAHSMQDFAVVMQIDDAVITSRYRPSAGMGPVVAWRMQIPAGTHTVEILNKETLFCGPLAGIGGCTVIEKSSHRVEFTAEPGRTYMPIVDQHVWQEVVLDCRRRRGAACRRRQGFHRSPSATGARPSAERRPRPGRVSPQALTPRSAAEGASGTIASRVTRSRMLHACCDCRPRRTQSLPAGGRIQSRTRRVR